MMEQKGEEWLNSEAYNCTDEYQALARKLFQNIPVSAITISESHLRLPSQHGRAVLFFLQKSPAGPHFVLYYKLSYNAMEETDYAFTGH